MGRVRGGKPLTAAIIHSSIHLPEGALLGALSVQSFLPPHSANEAQKPGVGFASHLNILCCVSQIPLSGAPHPFIQQMLGLQTSLHRDKGQSP